MKISGIYLIINTVNNKIYVGSAADILKRWTWHRRRLEIGKHHNQLLQRSYNKHGDVFHYCIVEECLIDNLFEIEQLWLDRTDCCNPEHGYNIYKTAGSPRGRKRSGIKEMIYQIKLDDGRWITVAEIIYRWNVIP